MNTKGIILLGALSLAFLASCQDDNDSAPVIAQGDFASVNFKIDASLLNRGGIATRAFSPEYSKENFSIYAFKRTGDGYAFSKTINLANMTYSAEDKMLTGTDNMEIGTYKFVPAYGIVNQSTLITPPVWSNSILSDGMQLTFNGNGALNEVFLDTGNDVEGLETYDFGLTEASNTTVEATLKRAVARVDIMFISADKQDDGTFMEKEYYDPASNVLGGKSLEKLELRFTGINGGMNIFGLPATTAIDGTFNLGNFAKTLTIGTGASTAIGKDSYNNYDNVQENDIIRGSAHIFGAYLFPGTAPSAGLQLYIKPEIGEARTITISTQGAGNLPIEQNKVTLVKVYVLKDNNVFSTTVDFEVEIETVWDDANEVENSIS